MLYQNYLLEQRTVEYLSVKKPILGARVRATVSACLSLEKYFCSFSNKICCVISESIPDPYFEDEEKRCFWRGKKICLLSKHCDHNAGNENGRNLTDSVSGSPTRLYKKHQTEQHQNRCRLGTADCGQRIQVHIPVKKLFCHIVILKRFLQFAIAKREISNSSFLPLTPPCCEAWPPRLGNRGESPLKVTGMFGAFHRGRSCTF